MPTAVNPFYTSVDMNLSYNSGTFAAPVLAVVNCRDVELGITFGEADVSGRLSHLELKEPALQVRELTFDILCDETDTNYVAIRNATLSRGSVEFFMANGNIGTAGTVVSGGTVNIVYSRCIYKVFGMKRGEPLEGAPTMSFTCKPCKATQTNAPTDNTLVA